MQVSDLSVTFALLWYESNYVTVLHIYSSLLHVVGDIGVNWDESPVLFSCSFLLFFSPVHNYVCLIVV